MIFSIVVSAWTKAAIGKSFLLRIDDITLCFLVSLGIC